MDGYSAWFFTGLNMGINLQVYRVKRIKHEISRLFSCPFFLNPIHPSTFWVLKWKQLNQFLRNPTLPQVLAPKPSASAQGNPQPKKTTSSQIQNITFQVLTDNLRKKLNSILPEMEKKKEKEVKEEGEEGRKEETIKVDLDLMQSEGPRDAQQPTLSGAQNQKAQLLQHTCSYSLLQSQTSEHILQLFLLHYWGRHASKRFHTWERISSVWFEKQNLCLILGSSNS